MKPHIRMEGGSWIVTWHGIIYWRAPSFDGLACHLRMLSKNFWGILR